MGVRRLAGESYQREDISLKRLLDDAIRDPRDLWPCFQTHFPKEAQAAMSAARRTSIGNLEINAAKRLLSADRALLLRNCKGAVEFANRRAAHSNPSVQVRTKFRDLDRAIDTIRTLTEKFILLLYDKPHDLFAEMLHRTIQPGWDEIFLKPWATRKTLALRLGEIEPPSHA